MSFCSKVEIPKVPRRQITDYADRCKFRQRCEAVFLMYPMIMKKDGEREVRERERERERERIGQREEKT